MKLQRIITLIFIVGILIPMNANASAKTGIHALARYESHSQTGNDDFVYRGVFVTKKLQTGFQAILSYLNKYNVEDEQTESHILNATISHTASKRLTMMYGYTNVNNPGIASRRPTGNDSDRWLIMGQYNVEKGKNSKLDFASSFTTATDFSDSRSLNEKLKYTYDFTKKLRVTAFAQYSYNLNLEDNLFNMYSVSLSSRLSRTTKLSATYLLVDMQTGNIDDDNIFQTGVFWTFR